MSRTMVEIGESIAEYHRTKQQVPVHEYLGMSEGLYDLYCNAAYAMELFYAKQLVFQLERFWGES